MTNNDVRRASRAIGVVIALTLVSTASAQAQGFVSPFIGFDFGGDSGCPTASGCEDRKLNAGVAIGTLGPVLGVELEFGYANDFFGDAPQYSSSVLTVMANLMLAPAIGPVRPYGTGGFGLIKTHVELTPPTLLLDNTNNQLGWNIGGGLMLFAGERVGIRGDLRRFHAFQELSILGLPLNGTTLDFNRASAALVVKF